MKEAHQTEITSHKEIWETIKKYHKNEQEKHKEYLNTKDQKSSIFRILEANTQK